MNLDQMECSCPTLSQRDKEWLQHILPKYTKNVLITFSRADFLNKDLKRLPVIVVDIADKARGWRLASCIMEMGPVVEDFPLKLKTPYTPSEIGLEGYEEIFNPEQKNYLRSLIAPLRDKINYVTFEVAEIGYTYVSFWYYNDFHCKTIIPMEMKEKNYNSSITYTLEELDL